VSEPSFLTLAEVLEIHQEQLKSHGGRKGVRDIGLLESAVAMAQSGSGGEYHHHSLFDMAAAYAFHIAGNQPFIDGNKRVGLAAALIFLDINGVEIEDPHGKLYNAMMTLGSKKMGKLQLAKLFEILSH
jgi:death-on-curing protein